MDDRIAQKLWGDPNVSDVTNERDVSDLTTEYDSENDVPEASSIPSFEKAPEGSIIFSSLDGKNYLIDGTKINWEATSQNEQQMIENKNMIIKMTMSIMSELSDTDVVSTEAAEHATVTVRQFIEDFGFMPRYNEVYPDASTHDFALCYCFDAINIINLMLIEIARYNGTQSGAKSALESLLSSMSEALATKEEENTDEN